MQGINIKPVCAISKKDIVLDYFEYPDICCICDDKNSCSDYGRAAKVIEVKDVYIASKDGVIEKLEFDFDKLKKYLGHKWILWLSRHKPVKEQLEELNRIFGNIVVVQISLTIESADDILRIMNNKVCKFDDLVAVLPINLYAELVSKGMYPIRAVMDRIVKDDGSVEFKFKYFERVKKVGIVTERL